MSQEGESKDPMLAKLIGSLQLHKKNDFLPSSVELQNSLVKLRDAVIVGTFPDVVPSPAPIDTDSMDVTTSEAAAITVMKEAGQERAHDQKIFNLSCVCVECSRHRETIIQLYVDDMGYNKLWEQVQDYLLDIYSLIPKSPDSPCYKKYQELMQKGHSKWLSDGRLDVKNDIRLLLSNKFPLNLKFDMALNFLYNRDAHQLLELLCMQIESVVMAYAHGLKEILHVDTQAETKVINFDACELLNYIFDGYTKICQFESKLSTRCYYMEAGHMLQFRTSLVLFFERQFQRCIFEETKKLMPECVQKLKSAGLTTTQCQDFLMRYEKFEEAMRFVRERWRDVWLLMHKYHHTKDELARRRSIVTVHAIFLSLRDTVYDEFSADADSLDTLENWLTMKDRHLVWQHVMHKIKSRWQPCTHPRLNVKLLDVNCVRCNSAFVPHSGACQCQTCIIAGAPVLVEDVSKTAMCGKCRFFENFKALDQEPVAVYHLAWAVFTQLQGRTPYTAATIQVQVFCCFQDVPCTRLACQVAANIIAPVYPVNFSNYLLKHYKPLAEAKRMSIMNLENIDVRQLEPVFDDSLHKSKLHPLTILDEKWCISNEEEEEDKKERASALAEGFLKDFPIPSRATLMQCFPRSFRPNGTDIELILDVTKRNEDDTNAKKILKRKERSDASDDKADGEIRKPLVEALSLSATNRTMERDLQKLRTEQARLSQIVKQHEKLHEEKHQQSDPDDGNKSSHKSEGQCICYYCTIFGQNDCAHSNRANETRERLRKRLQKNKRPVQVKPTPAPPAPKLQDPLSLQSTAAAAAAAAAIRQQQQVQQQHQQKQPSPPAPKPVTQKPPPTPINCAPVDDILKFIEGDTESSKKDKEAAARRAAKKRKQQLRKLELQRIDELNALKLKYDAANTQIETFRKQIKSLKKRKNKTRLHETETQLKNLQEQRTVITANVQKLIASIRDLNPEFKYELEPSSSASSSPAPIVPAQPVEQQPAATQTVQTGNCEISMDPAKRMVTIRRINLPNVQEPQVTVTAKGTTPDKDQLLYTFVNGQLVPASQSNQEVYQQVKAQTSPTYPANYFQPAAEKKSVPVVPAPEPPAVEPKKSEARKKVPPAGVQKMQEQIRKQQEKLAEMQREKQRKEERRENRAKVLPAPVEDEKPKNTKKKKEEQQQQPVETKKGKKKKNKVEEVKEEPKKSKRQLKQERRQQARTETPEEKPVIREKKKTPTYIDPQFDNNTFKLLNLDESESEESESDESFVVVNEEPKKRVEPTPPPPPPVEKKSEKKTERKKSVDEPKKKQQQPVKVETPKQVKQSQPKKVQPTPQMPKAPQPSRIPRYSIMDQLNRGVEVEGLRLPPGMTLTRVDSATFEQNKAKKESISRLSHPMRPVSTPMMMQAPPSMAFGENSYMTVSPMAQSQGVLTVDPPQNGENGKKARKRSRKKKNKDQEATPQAAASPIVTLRNSNFNMQGNIPPAQPMARQSDQQSAAIIGNENGMYTIRNASLHDKLVQGGAASNPLPWQSQQPQQQRQPPPNVETSYDRDDVGTEYSPSQPVVNHGGLAPIGSGRRYQPNIYTAPPEPFPLYANCYDIMNNSFAAPEMGVRYGYGDRNGYGGGSYSPSVPQQMHHQSYFDNGGNAQRNDEFLQNLKAGQQLNSEVTILSANEARFQRVPEYQSDGLEITCVPSASTNGNSVSQSLNDALNCTESGSINELTSHSFFQQEGLGLDGGYGGSRDYSDNYFDADMDDESPSPQFQHYPYQAPLNRAPGTGKPKSTRTIDGPPSSLFGGEISSMSSTTPPSSDDLCTDIRSGGSNSDSMPFYEDRKPSYMGGGGHGVIGGELKAAAHSNMD